MLPDGHQRRHLGGSAADSKDCQWGTVYQSRLGSAMVAQPPLAQQGSAALALNCQTWCLSSYFFLKNLEKDDLRDELAFLFYELIPKLSIGVYLVSPHFINKPAISEID